MPNSPLIISDEPVTRDLLGREVYARTLQKVAQNCQTPIVIGIHGNWGSGKTSLMRITQELLEKEQVKTVWFNPWIYQFDQSPIIPLLNEIKTVAKHYHVKITGLRLLTALTSLSSEAFLRIMTGGAVSTDFLLKQDEKFQEEYFEIRSITMRIHEHFQKVVDAIVGKDGRLVVFIDDLDRCCPPQALKVLEAIKLFLNAEKCIYIVGMDRGVIEQAFANQYGDSNISGMSYLDKIIQLPFKLPPVSDEGINKYLDTLKQDVQIEPYYAIIRKGTDHNPRAIKRFINTFLFNHTLAQEKKLENYKPSTLIKLLILQLSYGEFYNYISHHKIQYNQIENWALKFRTLEEKERKNIPPEVMNFLKNNDLLEIIAEEPLIQLENITPYIHLTKIFASSLCPRCSRPMREEPYDSWEGDSSGQNPRYRKRYVCHKCNFDELQAVVKDVK